MIMRDDRDVWDPLDPAGQKSNPGHAPDTPQARSPAYRLAYADPDFLAARNFGRCACSWNC
jgi:hypothetical protein